jgi:hypothetical protein
MEMRMERTGLILATVQLPHEHAVPGDCADVADQVAERRQPGLQTGS